jgi:hypothetical protein
MKIGKCTAVWLLSVSVTGVHCTIYDIFSQNSKRNHLLYVNWMIPFGVTVMADFSMKSNKTAFKNILA